MVVPAQVIGPILSFIFVTFFGFAPSNDVRVQVDSGVVKGEYMTSENGDTFFSFRGIPFAEPPVGNLRFKPPVPKKPWEGVLEATEDPPICPQRSLRGSEVIGEEDCLYLNVYTPKLPTEGDVAMDVLVNIPGGGFTIGAGVSDWYGPRRLKLNNIVLVSITYRVGIFGFLSTKDSISPGNYGLLDQLEALRWVHKNIHLFGGDPQRVTVLGESAGAASLMFHILSPLSQGLFQRAIVMSGSATCSWALQKDPIYWAKEMGKTVNCPFVNSKELVDCLRDRTAQELVEKSPIGPILKLAFAPVVDNYFVPGLPATLLRKEKFNKSIPILIGATKDEGACLYFGRKNSPDDFTEEEIREVIKVSLETRPNVEEAEKKVTEKYFSSLTSYKEREVQPVLSKAMADGLVIMCTYSTAKTMLEAGSNVFLYSYDYEAPLDGYSYFGRVPNKKGACHADDLYMLFDGSLFYVRSFDSITKNVKDKFQNIITNFAKTGNPFPEGTQQVDCKWPQARAKQLSVYHVNDKCSVDVFDEENNEFYQFWIKELPEVFDKIPVTSKF